MSNPKIYGVYLSFDSETTQDVTDAAMQKIKECLSTLNSTYNDDCELIADVDDYDYFVPTQNKSLLNDLVDQLEVYLKENSIEFVISIALIASMEFFQKLKSSPIQDTLDFMQKYIVISSDLATSECIVDNINYYQSSDDNIIYMITLQAKAAHLLSLRVACVFDKTDIIDFDRIVSLLDYEYNNILSKLNELTKEKDEVQLNGAIL